MFIESGAFNAGKFFTDRNTVRTKLKNFFYISGRCEEAVAPRAGAWIETILTSYYCEPAPSHPVRVRGLKHVAGDQLLSGELSHPVRVRGLKLH